MFSYSRKKTGDNNILIGVSLTFLLSSYFLASCANIDIYEDKNKTVNNNYDMKVDVCKFYIYLIIKYECLKQVLFSLITTYSFAHIVCQVDPSLQVILHLLSPPQHSIKTTHQLTLRKISGKFKRR